MKTSRTSFLLAFLMLMTIATDAAHADNYTDTIDLFKKSPSVQPFFNNAYGYAVFPIAGKGGLVVGAAYGQGQVYRKGELTGTTRMMSASIGLQAGGQVFSEIIFFQNSQAYNWFTSGNFEFGASFSAVAITAGAQATAGTEGTSAGASAGPATGAQMPTEYYEGMVVFIHAKGGLMVEASLSGQKFTFDPIK